MANVVAQSQTSRAGLISTLVVFIILTILMSVLFFKQNGETQRVQNTLDDTMKKYHDVITEPALISPDYTSARDQLKTAGSPSVFDLQVTQRNDLESILAGTPGDFAAAVRQRGEKAKDESNAALKDLSTKVGVTAAPGNNLIETLGRWPDLVTKAVEQREQLKKDVAAAEDKFKQMEAANTQTLADKDKAIADAKAETAKALDQVTQLQQAQTAALANVQTGANQSIANVTQQLQQVQGVVAQKEQAIAAINKRITGLLQALRRFKANPATKEDIIRVADGEIKTVAGTDCFINLGRGDQIAVGMTIEVYDPNKGIPPLGDGTASPEPVRRSAGSAAALAGRASAVVNDKFDYELPKGKGSIEVINVGPDHTSQCRIVHVEPGETISQGDIIANLVYDKNTKFNFVVYGDFDLSNSNAGIRANDAPVIRRLIEQWGGRVQPIADKDHPADSVTPETDFIIVGKEPIIPNYTPEELNAPENQLAIEKAKAKLEAYRAVLGKAADFGIPVMNQNRFLYYTGYFDQAKR